MKMIKIGPEGTHFLFPLLSALFSQGVLRNFAARPFWRFLRKVIEQPFGYEKGRKFQRKNMIFRKSVVDFMGEVGYTVSGAKWSKMALKWSGGEAHDR